MILEIQIIGVAFSLFMMYTTFLRYKRNDFSTRQSYLWFFLWLATLLLSLNPTVLDSIIQAKLGFSRRLDFFIIIGFFIFLAMLFYIYLELRKTQRRLEKMVQEIAIMNKPK